MGPSPSASSAPSPGLIRRRAEGEASGTAGGIELAALYDTVMRWNPDTQAFEPRTAASIQSNIDFTLWTLRLEPGIKFSDGTDYHANAVKFNIERQLAPTSRSLAKPILRPSSNHDSRRSLDHHFQPEAVVGRVPVHVDPRRGHDRFPGRNREGRRELQHDSWRRGGRPICADVVQVRRVGGVQTQPTLSGAVCTIFDQLTVVLLPGPDATFLGLKSGTLQAAFPCDPGTIDLARTDNYSMLTTAIAVGNLALFNSGAAVVCYRWRSGAIVCGTTRREAGRVHDGDGRPDCASSRGSPRSTLTQ